eukprot:XP_025980448.1 ATPase family AAA domain-containing protein 1-A-like [Glycine max]
MVESAYQYLMILVGLPSVEYREMILKTLLAKEKHKNLDFKELATMTEGYTGSDLKNLCITAAYRPVRELRQQERMKDMEKKKREAEGQSSEDASNNKDKEEQEITLTPSNMEDMRRAKSQWIFVKIEELKNAGSIEYGDGYMALGSSDPFLFPLKMVTCTCLASEGSVMNELKHWNDLYGEGGSRKKLLVVD